ncbi:MAG: extracellular solute-binding protein [Acinetobacter sp.]
MVEHLDMEQMFATGDDHMLKKQATVVIVLMLVSLMLSTAYAAEKVSVQGLWARSETNQGIKAEAKWYDAFQSTHENARIEVTHKSIYGSTKSLLKALDNSFKYDIFVVESATHDLTQVMSTQRCLNLSNSEDLMKQSEKMHKVFTAAMTQNDILFGIPISVSPSRILSYNEEAWKLAGLSQQDIPVSFDGLLDFLEKWVVQIKVLPATNTCVMNGFMEAGETAYTQWLLELLIYSQYDQYLYTERSVCFDTPDFINSLERIRILGSDLYHYDSPSEYSLFCDTSGDASTLGQWIPLRLTPNDTAVLPVDVSFLCVYAQSKSTALAIDVVSAYCDSICSYEPNSEIVSEDDQQLNIQKALLFSDFSGSVLLPEYQYMVQVRKDILARKVAALEDNSLSEANRKKAEEQVLFARETLAKQLEDQYILTAEQIYAYQQMIPYFVVTRPALLDIGSTAMHKLSNQFLSEKITPDEYAKEMERLVVVK